jgi:putative endonuclease
MPPKRGFVYIMTNHYNTTLYIGVTNDLVRRTLEHKETFYSASFTARYNCCKLVYYEEFHRITDAIKREKQLKKWRRKWKEELISKQNPEWVDLYPDELPDGLFMI